ncbi:MAG: HEPN domain-containing protein [Treponema sp.]|nr:HEPN domain-containing protein [Treponema sp.]
MDKEELVEEWLRYAGMDLSSAKTLLEIMHPAPLEIICFHCQQAAEKYLKAIIIHFDGKPDKTHDLSTLLDYIDGYVQIEDEFYRQVTTLTQFGVSVRYPNEIAIDEAMTKVAIASAEKVKQFAEIIVLER